MDYENKRNDSVYSNKLRAGKRRTYFFDVRATKGNDYYVTITESTRRYNDDGFERHKIFLYKEDFNRFLESLTDTIDHVKNELIPDYDYDEFKKRQEEWEKQKALEAENEVAESTGETENNSETESNTETETDSSNDESEMTW